MLYSIVRYAFFAIVFALTIHFIKKSKFKNNRKVYLINTLIVFIAMCASWFFPVEYHLFHFSTREKALAYASSSVVERVVEGKTSDLVFCKSDNKNTQYLIPKDEKGWKLPSMLHSETVIQTLTSDGLFVTIYKHKYADDYFISAKKIGGYTDLSDSCNSEFEITETFNEATGSFSTKYFSLIKNYDENYVLYADSKPVELDSSER